MNTSFKRLLAGILCFCMAFSMLPTGLATGDEITDVGLTHTVTFFDWDNRIVDTQEVADGQNATPPPTPTRSDGYMFDQWYPPENLENVTTDRSVTAVYTKLTEFRITIQYEFKDHRMAAQPFVAVVQKGGTINETVPSPEVIGFKPDQASVTLNVSDCNKDETYTVVYTPNSGTNYTVNHYLMGIDGQFPDTPSVTQTLNGEPGKMTEAVSLLEGENKENYKGYALFEGVAQARIAADGSTVVSIKYSRAKTQLVFDTGEDATAIAPVYNYFGAPFIVPEKPLRAGYRFKGWYTDDADNAKTSLTDLPVFNGKAELPLLEGEGGADGVLTLHAKWQGKKVNYKIVYWVEKPNEIDPNGKTEEQLNEAYAVKTNFGYFAQKMCEGVAGNTLKPWEQDDNPTAEAGVEFITKSALDPANVLANNDPQKAQCKYYAFHHCDPEVTVKGDGTTEINVYLIRKVYTLTFDLGTTTTESDPITEFPKKEFNYKSPSKTEEGESYPQNGYLYREVTKTYIKGEINVYETEDA